MKINKLIVSAFFVFYFLGISNNIYCQFTRLNDAPFFNKMFINPSFVANSDTSNRKELKLFAKSKFENPEFNSFSTTFECPLKRIKSGVGILLSNDNYFYITREDFHISINLFTSKVFYQYNPLKNLYIGASVGLINYQLDATLDGFSFHSHKSIQADIDLGILYKSKIFFAGMCLKNLNAPSYIYNTYKGDIPGYERNLNTIAGYKLNFKKHSLEFMGLYTYYISPNAHNTGIFSITSVLNVSNKLHFGFLKRFYGAYDFDQAGFSIIMGGTLFNKIKLSLGYAFNSSYYNAPDRTVQNIQGVVSYSFK